ncbi:hypothetical protein DR950_27725 [Kitasatospora xanthocidica]|uniref:Uncharacterized protein n=1 Tax=Kitasatospora xanthocidica TaxID=83382 RepID=A0A372ZZ33_9ACTN|nr:hypothetical protein DR950_27725 [Kitasatospora xanthocidica]
MGVRATLGRARALALYSKSRADRPRPPDFGAPVPGSSPPRPGRRPYGGRDGDRGGDRDGDRGGDRDGDRGGGRDGGRDRRGPQSSTGSSSGRCPSEASAAARRSAGTSP